MWNGWLKTWLPVSRSYLRRDVVVAWRSTKEVYTTPSSRLYQSRRGDTSLDNCTRNSCNYFAPVACLVLWSAWLYVCLSVCLSACVSQKVTKCSVHVTCGCGSVLLWQHCNTSCKNVMFSYNTGNRPESYVSYSSPGNGTSRTSDNVFGGNRQVAAPEAKSAVSECMLLSLFSSSNTRSDGYSLRHCRTAD